MQKTQGRAGNQAIWIGAPPYNPTGEALARVDDWLNNLHRYPWAGVARNKPAGAMDKCFDQTGRTLAAGDNVWDGILDPRPEGACTRIFHPYATSRMQAGGDLAGDVFKCQTMPLDAARARGIYAAVSFTPQEWARLAQIFPQGVCDKITACRTPACRRGIEVRAGRSRSGDAAYFTSCTNCPRGPSGGEP